MKSHISTVIALPGKSSVIVMNIYISFLLLICVTASLVVCRMSDDASQCFSLTDIYPLHLIRIKYNLTLLVAHKN